MYNVQVKLIAFIKLVHRYQILCFNTKSVWHGEERGQAKTVADFLRLCKGNITPRDVIFLTLAAQTSPPNLRLLLVSSLTIGAYCIYLQNLSCRYIQHLHGMWEARIQNLFLLEVSSFSLLRKVPYKFFWVTLSLLCESYSWTCNHYLFIGLETKYRTVIREIVSQSLPQLVAE